jgi:cell division protein FtsX
VRTRLAFLLREVAANLASDWLSTLSALLTVAVALACSGAAFLFLLNLDFQAAKVRANLELRAFLSPKLRPQAARRLATDIARLPGVAEARLIPREQAWEEFQAWLQHEQPFTGFTNPLQDVVAVVPQQPAQLASLARRLERHPGVETVRPSASEISTKGSLPAQLIRLLRTERLLLWGASALLALSVLLVLHNTIRLSLHRHWKEISIMLLLGANSGLVAGPFLLGGLLQGLVGALFSLALLLPGYWYLTQLAAASEPALIALPAEVYLWLAALLLGTGGLLGFSGALLSLRRFLRHAPVELS